MSRFACRAALLLALSLGISAPAYAAQDCAGRLGTSRVMEVDPVGLQVGTKQFPQTLDLADREVVLTFDDGPHPGTTPAVLKALARECVRATFFLIGRHAAAHPDLVRREIAAGHTVGHHSMTHPMTLADIPYEKAVADIEKGLKADDEAAYGAGGTRPRVPFFRFPGFGSSPALLAYLKRRGIGVFGADLWASDWNPMTPEAQLTLVMERLDHAGRGIILFHDTRAQTVKMLPDFLAALKQKGYRVVHIVPPPPQTAVAP
ncbi:polysaccharide deacetylase family protein [Ancylobacter dichloromethanicus]|uniref:Chitooligosaccharide deacetylase n=1 Tax=Ancylobacter dichloromethanicus TaxID=518825 RepID=A0A9W6MZA8_9HYPH|nr:polysaccharide deacetylase family protein [Ancylobacter dichloromethanicus]MBS7554687.1 polysaccharide deacetylase family protein [Ancylobacter dichloromethanicus]GLK71817.1 polysaccharide deacetylase [Ancylobacter dichloromethanicus]